MGSELGESSSNIEVHSNWRQYSRFYRDRATWEAVGDVVLWQLARDASLGHHDRAPDRTITAWSCGCSTGEEAFTLQLIWANRVAAHMEGCTLEVVGTDLSPDNIQGAQRGLYPPHALVELPPQWVLDSFEEGETSVDGDERFRLSEDIGSRTSFEVQDVTKSTASTRDGRQFDLIVSCYAICLYLSKEELTEVVTRIVTTALAPGGFLVLGLHDHLPPGWQNLGLSPVQCRSWGDNADAPPVRVYRKDFSECGPAPALPTEQGGWEWDGVVL